MNKKGQTAIEAVAIMMIFLTAFLCMRTYLRKAIQAHWKSNINSFSDEQYSRGASLESGVDGYPAGAIVYAETSITTNLTGTRNLMPGAGGVVQLPRQSPEGGW